MWRERAARCGEAIAEQFCKLRGYEILARNAREGRGELDLVALDRGTVVFVEVKFRAERDWGGPLAAVTAKKRDDVSKAATRWLAARGATGRPVRFDVIGITWASDGTELRVQHVPNAFPGGSRHFF
jgi:putative endonuclease